MPIASMTWTIYCMASRLSSVSAIRAIREIPTRPAPPCPSVTTPSVEHRQLVSKEHPLSSVSVMPAIMEIRTWHVTVCIVEMNPFSRAPPHPSSSSFYFHYHLLSSCPPTTLLLPFVSRASSSSRPFLPPNLMNLVVDNLLILSDDLVRRSFWLLMLNLNCKEYEESEWVTDAVVNFKREQLTFGAVGSLLIFHYFISEWNHVERWIGWLRWAEKGCWRREMTLGQGRGSKIKVMVNRPSPSRRIIRKEEQEEE